MTDRENLREFYEYLILWQWAKDEEQRKLKAFCERNKERRASR